ncbi:MAG: MATE family efflux transporter [Turicibacter sp.]|nr:MATE family efflux transporter [Turicibacter sp.]
MEDKKYDLTTGNILNKLLVIALPIMGNQLFQMLYNLTDMFFVGRVSSDAVAASGAAGMYLWLSVAFFLVGRMGGEIGVSQSIGRRDMKSAKAFASNAIFISIVLSALFTAAMILFRYPLMEFLGIQEATVLRDGAEYLAIVALGLPATFLGAAFQGAFTGAGNSRLPFYFTAIGVILNVILNPIFIFTFGMGLAGAAIATIIGQWTVAFLFIWAMKYHKARPFQDFNYRLVFKPSGEVLKSIFKWSIPISMESLFFTFLSMFITRFVAAFGSDALAAQRIGTQIESLSWLIGGGYASALTSFIGQNYGAQKWGRIRKGYQISFNVLSIWGIITTLIVFFFARPLMAIFIQDENVIQIGVGYLRIVATIQLFTCWEALAGGAFRGIGKTLPPSIISISGNVLRVGFAWALARTSLGIDGIWIGMCIGNVIRGLGVMIWYSMDSKKQPKEDVKSSTPLKSRLKAGF